MKTTAIIVEFLVIGVLLLLSLACLTFSLAPSLREELPATAGGAGDWFKLPLLAVAVISVAYGTGVLAEFLGLQVFEGWHRSIKRNYFDLLTKDLREIADSVPSPALDDPFRLATDGPFLKRESWTGRLRLFISHRSPELYGEIQSQLSRLRIIRVLLIVQGLLILAIVAHWSTAGISREFGVPLLVLMVGSVFNWRAIGYRFERYCKAIGRAYVALALTGSKAGKERD